MRAALKLSADGRKVGWIDREVNLSPREIASSMRAEDGPKILAVDNADAYGTALSPLIREISLIESRPLILLEMRSGRIDRAIIRPQLEGVPVTEVSMPHLSDRDIEDLIDVLDRENRLGILKGKSTAERIQAFKQQAGRQLLVAMYQATSGQQFEVKVAEECFELEGESQFVYGLLSVATAHRFGLSREEIVIATGDLSNATLNVIDKLIRRHLIVISRDKATFYARHRVIATILMDALHTRGSVKDFLYGLILASATKCGPGMSRSSKSCRMLRVFLNHELLFRMRDSEQARNLYGSVEQLLNWNSHFWLQRRSLEVEEGDLGLAENFLSQARSMDPENRYIDNEWAYLLFKKAIIRPGSLDSPNLVNEAMRILNELIDAEPQIDRYPYHVLGSQGLAWARRGIREEEKRARFLQKLVTALQIGVKKFPDAKELGKLEEALRKELFSLAVPLHLRQ